MDRSRKYCTQGYPQECSRSEHDAHNGSEDGAKSGNVEELDEEYFPRRQRAEIHVVASGDGRHRPSRGCCHDAVDEESINEVAADEHCK